MPRLRFLCLCLAAALGCVRAAPRPTNGDKPAAPELDVPGEWVDPLEVYPKPRPAPSSAPRRAASTYVLRHVKILTGDGRRLEDGAIVLQDGLIAALGDASLPAPQGAIEIDGAGRYVTPGIIDTHSHIGVYPAPNVQAHSDGNEMSAPITPDAAAAYGYWPQDPAITRALAGGVTAAQILPGSANLIGGRGVIVEMRPGRHIDEVRFPGAPATIKMACGENPKRTHGQKGGPQTRMGLYAAFRAAFQDAAEYQAKHALYARERAEWEKKRARARELDAEAARRGHPGRIKPEPAPQPPPIDPKLEVLAAVLRGEVLVQIHCYRADEIAEMVRIADEFGFPIRSFHHALEAYKVRDLLIARGIAISTWADWWGFKMEAFDGIPENAALFWRDGGRPVIHSDSPIGIQRLNQEAAKAMYAGRASGIDVSEDEALRWITSNPAWVLGIDQVTGTLAPGKRGDVVVWSAHPFSVYARADLVFVGGDLVYDRRKGRPTTDFELGVAAPPALPEEDQ